MDQKPEPTHFSGEGMLSSVIPVTELKIEIEKNLNNLEVSLRDSDQAAIRALLHDLMGFCGLYGITDIRNLALELKSLEEHSLGTSGKIIDSMRQCLVNSDKFKSSGSVK